MIPPKKKDIKNVTTNRNHKEYYTLAYKMYLPNIENIYMPSERKRKEKKNKPWIRKARSVMKTTLHRIQSTFQLSHLVQNENEILEKVYISNPRETSQ